MRIWSGTMITSTMRRTRPWACPWALGWSKVLANGSSNNVSKGLGCGGARTVSTTSCTSGSPGSMDALRPCSVWPCPRTRNCAPRRLLSQLYGLSHVEIGVWFKYINLLFFTLKTEVDALIQQDSALSEAYNQFIALWKEEFLNF